MDVERKINLSEGVPLNSTGAANIFLNTGKNTKTKVNSPDGTVIHLKTEKPSDLGVHINTTFSIASSKKIKLLFVLNFLLSVVCMVFMVICCSGAFYYWNEMISMRRQLDFIKDQVLDKDQGFLVQNLPSLSQDRIVQSALVGRLKPPPAEAREARMGSSLNMPEHTAKKYYVEDLGEDMLLVDSKKKNLSDANLPTLSILQKDLLVVQFNGAIWEQHLGTEPIIGPWVRDNDVSSKNSEDKIELNNNSYVTIKESGLYLVYAQIVYLTQAPNCYFIMASQTGVDPRILSTCATGDDASERPLDKSQISCATQAVARLNKGDIVNIAQRELNRTVWLRKGYSYFGFVKLSS